MIGGLNAEDIKSIISLIKNIMDENRDYLIDLDNVMGDGDLGITMTKAFTAANEEAQKSSETNPSQLLIITGMAIAKAAPSTMGTLIATGFMKGGKAMQGMEVISLSGLAIFFQAFTQGIMDRGKAKPGDKTIVDVLHPVALSLLHSSQYNKSLSEGIADAFQISQQAVHDTTQLKAQHGRAAYYQDASIGKQDAGSTVGMLIMKGFYKHATDMF
jgi:phosphoenolpyruvate---glycerone phosphotransferase subunit DhaL